MIPGFDLLALAAAAMSGCGVLTLAGGLFAVSRFAQTEPPIPTARPPVSVLRPLCGAEPMLEAALASLCAQRYPQIQLVLGVQDPHDPAIRVVERIRDRFPGCDITLVSDTACHGSNRKISNLINMLPAARHELLVFSDSDLHVAPDYLDRVVAALEAPDTGLVTTVCAGLPVVGGVAARLGATAISHCFVPAALLSRVLGRQDCLGTTMALTRATLVAIGGLPALRDHLADDNVLGQLVRRQGLSIALARSVPHTAVPEQTLGALWQHELRWARTIRGLEPALFALSIVQYPLFWAMLAAALHPGRVSIALFGAVWVLRAVAARAVDRALQPDHVASAALLMLLPLRDLLSATQIIASFFGTKVVWRGQMMRADAGRPVQV